jgi:hypothetical protein
MAKSTKTPKKPVQRTFDARRDTADFRDLMFVPTLVEVPTRIPLADYLKLKVPVLDQGTEGACTGFGLATVANYLLLRRRVVPDPVPVSARMLYEMARRYDEWPGENYSGSSARGAMKGWHKHGVTSEKDWPYTLKKTDPRGFTAARAAGALKRPLGAYFRVNHRDLIAMHAAIAEVGVLYATASVHAGWSAVGKDGVIEPSDKIEGGHAFAIVAYDDKGFWIQNSWGPGWGKSGMARVSYDDWLANGTDVWVARLGAPVVLRDVGSTSIAHASTSGQSAAYAYAEVRPHIVAIGNDGALRAGGDYGCTPDELQQVFEDDIPRAIKTWKKPRLLLYAHGGLVSERAAVQRVAEYRKPMLEAEVYPLAFIWRSDYWTTITNILQDAMRRRRPEGVLDAAKDFLLDRLDDALEPIARVVTGKAAWDEMKENALGASDVGQGARLVLGHLKKLLARFPTLEIHIAGHSAGSIFHAPVVQLLTTTGPIASGPMQGQTGMGLKVTSCTLWAPACRMDLFKATYLPAVQSKAIGRFAVFVLDDVTERDDNCAKIYNKSLLYLVSNAFESPARIPLLRDGVPLLGLHESIKKDTAVKALFDTGVADLVVAPNARPQGAPDASGARHHGDFDDDIPTVLATLTRITGAPAAPPAKAKAGVAPRPAIRFMPSQSSLRERRLAMDGPTQVRR